MKLFKKLLPIATIASSAIALTPICFGCSKGYVAQTSDINYKPSKQHDFAVIDTKEKLNALIDEYYKDPNIWKEDCLYSFANDAFQAVEGCEESLKKGEITSYEVTFTGTINSFAIKESKILDLGGKIGQTNGYLFDFDIEFKLNEKVVYPETETTVSSRELISYLKIQAKNLFAFLSNLSGWERYGFCVYSHPSIDWTFDGTIAEEIIRQENNKQTGKIKTTVEEGVIEETKDDKTKKPTTCENYWRFVSYYLTKVTINI